ncbi:MAG: DUF3380 domain-containing protein [Acidobacteriota bacterium]|nr:DUF3380 domain-containing protein [Acidobacteriota bacterium]
MPLEFTSASLAMTTSGMNAAAEQLGVSPIEIWTVFDVETKGCGFLPDRRPPILYERHIFHRLTAGQFDDGDISDKAPGGYGPDGAHQYDRLDRAIALNREAALKSCSWGLGQIMGENFAAGGFPNVEGMVTAMCTGEDAQLLAVAGFIVANRLVDALKNHRWAAFASVYNGPSYIENRYDTKLAGAFAKFSAGALPDLNLRSAQLYLTYRGFNTGGVDGLMGPRTRSAITQFQQMSHLPVTGVIDSATLTALQPNAT